MWVFVHSYCQYLIDHCSQLVIDKSLATLPRRKTDNAIIIRSQETGSGKARVFKLNAVAEDPILLERWYLYPSSTANFYIESLAYRENGHERQYRFHCPRCSLKIAYQSSPPPVKSAPFLYLISGALTQMQGQVPPDAFDGENDLWWLFRLLLWFKAIVIELFGAAELANIDEMSSIDLCLQIS